MAEDIPINELRRLAQQMDALKKETARLDSVLDDLQAEGDAIKEIGTPETVPFLQRDDAEQPEPPAFRNALFEPNRRENPSAE